MKDEDDPVYLGVYQPVNDAQRAGENGVRERVLIMWLWFYFELVLHFFRPIYYVICFIVVCHSSPVKMQALAGIQIEPKFASLLKYCVTVSLVSCFLALPRPLLCVGYFLFLLTCLFVLKEDKRRIFYPSMISEGRKRRIK